jgi:ABC-type bacteriocin/lantibiotic exporter with double-glycine peptidase domain
MDPREALATLLKRFDLQGRVDVPRTGGWRQTLTADFRRLGLETRVAKLGPNDVANLVVPAVLFGGNGEWMFLDGTAVPAPEWEGWELAEALEVVGRAPDNGQGLLGRLWVAIRFRRDLTAKTIGYGLLAALATATVPMAAGLVMGTALPDGAPGWLAAAAIASFFATALAILTGWLSKRLTVTLLAMAMADLQRGVVGHTFRLPLLALQSRTMGDRLAIQRAEDSARTIYGIAAETIIRGGSLAYSVTYMVVSMPVVALVFLAGAAVVTGVTLLVARLQIRLGGVRAKARQDHRGRLAEMIAGISSLRAHDAIERTVVRWKGLLRQDILATKQMAKVGAVGDGLCSLMSKTVWATALLLGAWFMTQGDTGMGNAITFIMMAATAMDNTLVLGQQWVAAKVELTTIEKVDAVITEKTAPSFSRPDSRGPISFRGVGFRYGDDLPWILRDLDLTIREGETVWLKSPSGSGKSTLLRLMSGLTSPSRGHVLIGGEPIYGADMPIGYLPQGAELMDDSIMENLLALSGWAPRARLLELAVATGLADLVATLPMGYSTRATMGTFSGGQRQLILLTGVLAQESGILLLDEPMSAMDWAMRERVTPVLQGLGRTLVYVSHDIPIGGADRIFSPLAKATPSAL